MKEETGMQVRDGGALAIPQQAELATSQVAEMARAQIESQFAIAIRRPRNEDSAREKLLKDCQRPSFCAEEGGAIYRLPFKNDTGKPVEGLSIRFAEAAARAWGNLLVRSQVIFDDGKRRNVHITGTDLETNTTIEAEVLVDLVVLRKYPDDTRELLGVRTNSKGQQNYIYPADERESAQLTASATSKGLRGVILRLIPGWLQDECIDEIYATMATKDAEDPDAARHKLLDAFADVGVTAEQVAQYVGHGLGSLVPAELKDLRALYVAIRDGETTWQAVLASKGQAEDSEPKATLKDKVDAKRKKADPEPKPAEVVNSKTGEVTTPPTRQPWED